MRRLRVHRQPRCMGVPPCARRAQRMLEQHSAYTGYAAGMRVHHYGGGADGMHCLTRALAAPGMFSHACVCTHSRDATHAWNQSRCTQVPFAEDIDITWQLAVGAPCVRQASFEVVISDPAGYGEAAFPRLCELGVPLIRMVS